MRLNISEIRKPELDAQLVAESISQQIEKRVMFRRAMKRAVMSTMRSGALGIKVRMSGRLNGSEIARTEWYREGRIPLHTFRADIDYGLAEATTTYGVIGIKVWIFKGEVFDQAQLERQAAEPAAGEAAGAAAPAAAAAGRRRRGAAPPAQPQRRREADGLSAGTRTRVVESCCNQNEPNTASSSRATTPAWRCAAVPWPSATTGSRPPTARA